MSLKLQYIFLIITTCKFQDSLGITNGHLVETEKRFIVYLLKAPQSPTKYRGWLCGGSIISHNHVLTSASCVVDVQFVYVISGYKKYVPDNRIDEDECIKRKKKKIIRVCVPNAFSDSRFLGSRNDYWNWGDIAVALVDTPFDFMDMTYYTYCSYPPNVIEVNMLSAFEKAGTDTISYGWGHTKYQRPKGDLKDYNEKYLRYSSNMITGFDRCKSHAQSVFRHLGSAYSRFLLCVIDYGNIDERGYEIDTYDDIMEDCQNVYDPYANGDDGDDEQKQKLKQKTLKKKCQQHALRGHSATTDNDPQLLKVPGICQNDHGGPLTTWRGGKEILIGVASTYTTSPKMQCRAPYGYTSTHCNNQMIACALWPHVYSRRSLNCDMSPQDRSYYLVERNISWSGHPDGFIQIHGAKKRPSMKNIFKKNCDAFTFWVVNFFCGEFTIATSATDVRFICQ